MKGKLLGVVAALASAGMHILAFEPWGQAWAGWFCLIPLLLAVRAGLAGWKLVWCAGTLAWLGGVWWIWHVTPVGMVLLCAYLGAYWIPFGWVWKRACLRFPNTSSRGNLAAGAIAAVTWVALEAVRGWMFSGFPWNNLAVSQWRNLVLIQVASVGGTALLSALLVLANAVGALTLVRFKREAEKTQKLRPHLDFSATMALTALSALLGLRTVWRLDSGGMELRFAAVQGNIPQDQKFDALRGEQIFDIYAGLSQAASATQPDLLLWPETATGTGLMQSPEINAGLREMMDGAGFTLVAGSVLTTDAGDFNAAFSFPPGDGEIGFYSKQHLVPFGEFIPGRRWFPWIANFIPIPSDYVAGTNGGPLRVSVRGTNVALGLLICFEDVLPYLARARAEQGAQVLVNLTNDGWFKESPGAWQHVACAVFRCVETRLPMLRAANTGVTCAIDPAGRITDLLQDENGRSLCVRGFLSSRVVVPSGAGDTWYLRGGRFFPLCCVLLAGCFAAYELIGRQRPPRAASPLRAAQEVSLTRRPNAKN